MYNKATIYQFMHIKLKDWKVENDNEKNNHACDKELFKIIGEKAINWKGY